MHPIRRLRIAFISCYAALAACGNSDLSPGSDSGSAGVQPQDLCVDSGCGAKTRLVAIPDAENILFTPEGRLFVSGGLNVYEITRTGENFMAQALSAADCNFTGLAQRGTVLYAACNSGQLYAAQLTAMPALQPIHTLAGMNAANGTAVGPDGELYVVNGPLSGSAPDPKIVRLRFDSANALQVVEQTDWLATGLEFPNGLAARGRTLYVTDGSSESPGLIKSIQIMDDGSPDAPQTISAFTSILDDLSGVDDHLLVSEFSAGAIALIDPAGGIVAQTDPGSFDSPSAVHVGQAPLFEATDILVTEKGVLQEYDSTNGNALSVFRRTP